MKEITPRAIRRSYLNPDARASGSPGLFDDAEYGGVAAFFDRRPDLVPSPVHDLRGLAAHLGLGRIWLKDESARFGLNAFKAVGAVYAMHRLQAAHRVSEGAGVVCASSGNHGRAVAWAARTSGLRARVFVPRHTVVSRIEAIAGEGAEVIVSAGPYENAVRQAAAEAERGWTVVSDTGWPGYAEVPRWIMAGYTRLMDEAASAWGPRDRPDLVLVQAGVGGLACAVASWFAHRFGADRPWLATCEPASTACLLESMRHGEMVRLGGPYDTHMAGLQCAEISFTIWPAIRDLVDACIAIDEPRCADTMRRLATPAGDDPPIVSGPSGACGLATLLAMLEEDDLRPLRDAIGLGSRSRVLVINTEGATDPVYYNRILGTPP